MTREQYDELSAPLVRTLLDMEDDILREIAAQLAKDGKVSDTSKWRIRQLARSGRFDKRAAAIIDGYSGVQNGQALDMVLAAAQTEIGYLDNAVQAANAAGLSEYFSDIPAETSALNAAKAFQRQAASDLNLVNTVMKYKAGSAFVSAVNSIYRESQKNRQDVLDVMGKSSAKVVMGHMSLQEATRKTIRELARKGIPAFVDKAGREWSPEAYIMMDMRSTLGNTARAAQDMRCDQYGIQLIEVSSHMGARPLCAPYQGRIFSRDGSKGITTDGAGGKIYYTPLSETSYGQPAGLFGINCGHVQYPFVPGVNFQRYFPYPKEENDRRYMQFQQQRAMERDIRATKRECMMLQELDDKEGLQKASQRLRAQKQKYSQYSKDCGLGTHYDRTQVYGYDRSKSSKTVWAERKAQTASGGSAPVSGGSSGGNVQNYLNSGLTNGGGSGMMKMGKVKGAYKQTTPDFTKYEITDDIQSVNTARNLLISEFGIAESDIDFSGIRNAEVLKPFSERLVKIKNETGLGISKIKAAEIIDGDEYCIASYKPFERTLYISSRYFNSEQALTDTLKDWASNGIMPKQCATIRYLAEHEAAHIRIPDSVIRSEEAIKIWKKRKLINDNDSDIYEYYADAVAIYKTSSKYDTNIQNAIEYLIKEGVKI